MPAYRLTRAASDDLVEIFLEGLVLFGPDQADRYHDGLRTIFAFLAEHPRAARLREEIRTPVRVHRYKSHMIVYELDDDETVVILRVRHGREDWIAQAGED